MGIALGVILQAFVWASTAVSINRVFNPPPKPVYVCTYNQQTAQTVCQQTTNPKP